MLQVVLAPSVVRSRVPGTLHLVDVPCVARKRGCAAVACGAHPRWYVCVFVFVFVGVLANRNACALAGALSFTTWGLTLLWNALCSRRPQNLKKKYGAEWAVVTGGSSGIGRALVNKLARSGLNVVIVAMADKLMDETMASLKEEFPEQVCVRCLAWWRGVSVCVSCGSHILLLPCARWFLYNASNSVLWASTWVVRCLTAT